MLVNILLSKGDFYGIHGIVYIYLFRMPDPNDNKEHMYFTYLFAFCRKSFVLKLILQEEIQIQKVRN